jgi:hypothetical protein
MLRLEEEALCAVREERSRVAAPLNLRLEAVDLDKETTLGVLLR